MKFIHISDLHLGKRIYGVSMLEDQSYILQEILRIAKEQAVDGVIIAGDIYDKSIPPASAVEVFDQFLVELASAKYKVFMISGNHDSPERLAFGGRLMEQEGVYMSPVFQKEIKPVEVTDEYGTLHMYLLPFVKPIHVREAFEDESIKSYTQAAELVIRNMNVDESKRNILITHQFVTGAIRSESEDISVGGSDNVNAEVFNAFDYVALGHLHGPQSVTRATIRYCGTPLKYSFSEARHEKSVTIVEVGDKSKKGEDYINVTTIPLVPRRDMHVVKGTFEQLTANNSNNSNNNDSSQASNQYDNNAYVHVTLTDEEEIPEVMTKLRGVFPNIMKMDYDNTRTRTMNQIEVETAIETKSPLELFETLYQNQNNTELKKQQWVYLQQVIEQIWGEQS